MKKIICALLLLCADAAAQLPPKAVGPAIVFTDGQAQGVSAAGQGKQRYNNASHRFEASVNGGSYAPLGGGTIQQAYDALNGNLQLAQSACGFSGCTAGALHLFDAATPIGPVFVVSSFGGSADYVSVAPAAIALNVPTLTLGSGGGSGQVNLLSQGSTISMVNNDISPAGDGYTWGGVHRWGFVYAAQIYGVRTPGDGPSTDTGLNSTTVATLLTDNATGGTPSIYSGGVTLGTSGWDTNLSQSRNIWWTAQARAVSGNPVTADLYLTTTTAYDFTPLDRQIFRANGKISGVTQGSAAGDVVSLANKSANTLWAGPSSGGAALPTFRALVSADLPAGVGTVTSVSTGNGLQGGAITSTGTVDLRLNASGGLTKTLGGGSNELGIAAAGVSDAMLASTFGKLGTAQTWTKAQHEQTSVLTDASTVTFDASLSDNYTLTIAGNRTLGAPSNLSAGNGWMIAITQGSGGSHTLAYNAAYKFAGGTAPTLSTTAAAVDVLSCRSFDGSTVLCTLIADVR